MSTLPPDEVVVLALGALVCALPATAVARIEVALADDEAPTLAAALGVDLGARASYVVSLHTARGIRRLGLGEKGVLVALDPGAWMPLPPIFARVQNGVFASLVRLGGDGARFALGIDVERVTEGLA